MKKVMSVLVAGSMLLSGAAFAGETAPVKEAPIQAVPVLISAPVDQPVPTLYDTPALYDTPVLISANPTIPVQYKEETMLKGAVRIEYTTYVPLKEVAEAMGYTITWNEETRSVAIQKGAQWTSVTIGENAYFRNRMAPWALSGAPIIQGGHTYVPVEFFHNILGKGLSVEAGTITFSDAEMAVHSGYVKDVQMGDKGVISITIGKYEDSEEMMDLTVIHTTTDTTVYQTSVEPGTFINVICPPIMTMSIPGQTSGLVVY